MNIFEKKKTEREADNETGTAKAKIIRFHPKKSGSKTKERIFWTCIVIIIASLITGLTIHSVTLLVALITSIAVFFITIFDKDLH
jgi:hypothetical protein